MFLWTLYKLYFYTNYIFKILSQHDISKIIEASDWSNLSVKLTKLKLSEENQLAFWDKGHRLLLAHLVSHQLFSESVFNKIFSDLSTFDYKDREYLIKHLSINNNLYNRQKRLLSLSRSIFQK